MDKRKALIELLSTLKVQAKPGKKPKTTILDDIKYESLMYILDETMDQLELDRQIENSLYYQFDVMDELIPKMRRALDRCKSILNEEIDQ